MRLSLRLLLLGSFVPLAGCMTSGTNMHGDFACRAPNGTCAPMSSIDAKAIAGIGASTQPVGGITDPAMPRGGRVVTASTDGSPPGRTSDRVLRVVFPAHIDASGIYHDESTAHAVIERGDWTDSLTGGARRNAEATQTVAAAQNAGPDASSTSKLASLDEVIAGKAASTRTNEGQALAGSFAPTWPSVPTPVVPRAAIMRSATAIDLREAAVAASALPVAGLDPIFDTPDVAAVVADQATAAAEHCTGYRPVWWHGHAYRRLRPVPCPTTVAAVEPTSSTGNPAFAPSSTRALNLAHNDPVAAPVAGATPAAMAGAAAPVPSTSSSLAPPAEMTSTASAPANKAVGYAPTTDAKVVAARVSMLTKPIIADQSRLGRADAKAAAPPPIGQLLAGTGVTANAVSGETPQ